MKSKALMKNFVKSGRSLLIVGITIFVVSVLMGGFLFVAIKTDKGEDFRRVDGDFVYSKLEVAYLDASYATEKSDGEVRKYYVAYDENKVPYVVCLNDEIFNKLKKIYDYSLNLGENQDENDRPASVVIYGDSQKLPKEAVSLLSDWWQEDDGTKLSSEEVRKLVGNYYLDTYYDMNEDLVFISTAFGVFALLGLILILVYVIRNKKTYKALSKYERELEEIAQDLESGSGTNSKKCRVILTSKFVLSYQNGLKLFENKDIVWIYPFTFRQNGFLTYKCIYVITKDGKSNIITQTSTTGLKKQLAYEELYQEMMNRMPNILHGYTKENQMKAKELYRR